MDNRVKVLLDVCRDGAVIPKYAKSGDAGMDVYAAEDIVIEPGQTAIIPLGIKLAIPNGYEIQVRPRSGISFNTPLRLPNSPGTIDSGYRNELGILVHNSSCRSNDNNIYTILTKGNIPGKYRICKGDRIAQIVLKKVPVMEFEIVDDIGAFGTDRGGGFGSTGVR